VKTREGDINDEATGPLDQEAIARLAYFYWEARRCPNDSPATPSTCQGRRRLRR